MGFSRQEYWSGLQCPPPGDLPNPGIGPRSPALQVDSSLSAPPRKPMNTGVGNLSLLQVIFPTQESYLGLLLCRQILHQLSHKGSPFHPAYPTPFPIFPWRTQRSSLINHLYINSFLGICFWRICPKNDTKAILTEILKSYHIGLGDLGMLKRNAWVACRLSKVFKLVTIECQAKSTVP